MKGKLTERFMRIHLISLRRHRKYGTDFSSPLRRCSHSSPSSKKINLFVGTAVHKLVIGTFLSNYPSSWSLLRKVVYFVLEPRFSSSRISQKFPEPPMD